jgi:replicative DNA helicase
VATELGNRAVAIFSPGTPGKQVIARMMAAQTLVPQCIFNTGMIKEEHWPKITAGAGWLSEGIYVDDTAGIYISDLLDSTKRLWKTLQSTTRSEPKLGFLVVDDIELMRSSRRCSQNKNEEYEGICQYLKILARELDIPVLLVSRLREKRDVGVLHHCADIILKLQRDGFSASHQGSTESDNAEVIVVKNKRGPSATVKLYFRRQYPRFSNFCKAL